MLQETFHDIHKGLTRRGASTACIVTIGSDGRTACGFNLVGTDILSYGMDVNMHVNPKPQRYSK